MIRLLAVVVLVIPGILAAYGIELMRDALFHVLHPFLFTISVQFLVGLLLMVGGIYFIGGFIVHHDHKKNKPKRKKKSPSS